MRRDGGEALHRAAVLVEVGDEGLELLDPALQPRRLIARLGGGAVLARCARGRRRRRVVAAGRGRASSGRAGAAGRARPSAARAPARGSPGANARSMATRIVAWSIGATTVVQWAPSSARGSVPSIACQFPSTMREAARHRRGRTAARATVTASRPSRAASFDPARSTVQHAGCWGSAAMALRIASVTRRGHAPVPLGVPVCGGHPFSFRPCVEPWPPAVRPYPRPRDPAQVAKRATGRIESPSGWAASASTFSRSIG